MRTETPLEMPNSIRDTNSTAAVLKKANPKQKFVSNQAYAVFCVGTRVYTRLCLRKPAYPLSSSKIYADLFF